MSIPCEFKNLKYFCYDDECYSCEIIKDKIIEGVDLEFDGQHEAGKTNEDVVGVRFFNCTVTKVPQGLKKIFQNMKILMINTSNLKNLNKTDLAEYKNLERFICEDNQIETLPGDLFEYFKNLELISFYYNNINFIEPNILDGLENLKVVDFIENLKFDKFFSVNPKNRPNATLQEVKSQLFEQFYKSGEENVKNYITKIHEKLTTVQHESDEKIQELTEVILKLSQDVQKYSADVAIFDDLKGHIRDENLKDFNIEIDGREFPVHKLLLAIGSPTLAEMLRNNPEAQNLKLVDIPIEIFEVILKFLYTDELPRQDGLNFLHVFAAASRLRIKKLKEFAAVKVLDQINLENAIEVLDLGNKHGHDGLRQKAFETIRVNYAGIKFKDESVDDAEKVKKMVEFFTKMEATKREFSELMD